MQRGRAGVDGHRVLLAREPRERGFKLLDREKTVPILRKMVIDRFAFDVELLTLAGLAGLRVLEEPVIWRNSPDSRVAPIHSSWNMFMDVVRLRRRIRTFLEQQLAAMESVELDPPGSRGGAIVEPVGERMARELAPESAAERDAQAADRTPEPTPEPATAGEMPFWSTNE